MAQPKHTTSPSMLDTSGYTRMSRRFARYRWWRPLLVMFVAFVIWIAFETAGLYIVAACTGTDATHLAQTELSYDEADFASVGGLAINLGTIALSMPALFLSMHLFRERPFATVSSVHGRIRWSLLFKCLAVAMLAVGIVNAVMCMVQDYGQFTPAPPEVIVAIIILTPLQCAAEEYIFRGYLMQTLGGWIPIVALVLVLQALCFAWGHLYNDFGLVTVWWTGIVYGILTIRSGGLEASIACHTANNLIAFASAALFEVAITSEVALFDAIIDMALTTALALIILHLGNKRGWFSSGPDRIALDDANRS